MEVLFDPGTISYEELLKVFWNCHNPSGRFRSRQYMAAVFCFNDEQRRIAEGSKVSKEKEPGISIATRILPIVQFYPAEDYHQKYYLRHNRTLLREFRRLYPREDRFRDSTATARINGLLGGYGLAETYSSELEMYGLSRHARSILEQRIKRLKPVPGCALPVE